MFIPFKININEIDKLQVPVSLAPDKFKEREKSALSFLKKKIDPNTGVFDAEELKKCWLPVDEQYHIFISYSHDDKPKAIKLASWFESHGVRCFLDAYYWNNADDLLKSIDDAKCKNPNRETYSYKKRNYSTSLIHAMLSMAIMEAIDKCDFGIFIESPNSLTLNLDNIQSFTLSPWIYEELNLMTSIEKRTPYWLAERQIRMFSQGAKMIVESTAPIKMRFTVPLDQLAELEATDLMSTKGEGTLWLNNFVSLCERELMDV
ncbi:MAG: toll/interleukin-1 receptor domain-containing protein [Paludibacteraceae bacterium]|nr:toll/interleukin-1 receptor domain-containing protein [Paludibacteraceae bacterium]